MRVQDLHRILAHQLELHDYNVVLDILQVHILCLIEHFTLIDRLSTHHILKLLLLLALNEKLVSMVGLLIDLVVLMGVFDLNKLWDGSLLHDFLSALLYLPVHVLLNLLMRLPGLILSDRFLQTLRL